jgi:hypothetical protein
VRVPPEQRATSGGSLGQAGLAAHYDDKYSIALAGVAACVAIIVALLTGLGVEAKGVRWAGDGSPRTEPQST